MDRRRMMPSRLWLYEPYRWSDNAESALIIKRDATRQRLTTAFLSVRDAASFLPSCHCQCRAVISVTAEMNPGKDSEKKGLPDSRWAD